jgi:hypothetical protein
LFAELSFQSYLDRARLDFYAANTFPLRLGIRPLSHAADIADALVNVLERHTTLEPRVPDLVDITNLLLSSAGIDANARFKLKIWSKISPLLKLRHI